MSGAGWQERACERLVRTLAGFAIPLAQRCGRLPVDAITPESVDTIKALSMLGQDLPEFCRRAVLGEIGPDAWADMSTVFQLAARACREQVVIQPNDLGDSGGR